jgi:hypothetical protein
MERSGREPDRKRRNESNTTVGVWAVCQQEDGQEERSKEEQEGRRSTRGALYIKDQQENVCLSRNTVRIRMKCPQGTPMDPGKSLC